MPCHRACRHVVALAGAVLLNHGVAVAEAPHLDLPATAPARRTVEPVEAWRIGAEDEEILLGMIFDARLGADGNVYLIDRQLSQVVVVSPEGELVTTLGRQGEGPGELNRPTGLYLRDEGGVGVVQGFPGKITLIDADDVPAGEIPIGGPSVEGGFHFISELRRGGDCLVAAHGRGTFDMETGKNSQVLTFTIMDLQGSTIADVFEHTRENDMNRFVFDEAGNFSEMSTWAVGPDDIIYTVPDRDAYRLNVRDKTGAVLRVLERPFDLRKRSQEDRDELAAGMVVVINGERQDIENKALDHDPAIMGLEVARDGRLFVTNCHQQRKLLDEGEAARYDVISPEGRLVEELTVHIAGFDNTDDRLVFLDGENFVLIRNHDQARDSMRAAFDDGGDEDVGDGDAEPLEVVFYRGS